MKYRIVEVSDADALSSDLTPSELIGVTVYLAGDFERCPWDTHSIYKAAWCKIIPMADLAQNHVE